MKLEQSLTIFTGVTWHSRLRAGELHASTAKHATKARFLAILKTTRALNVTPAKTPVTDDTLFLRVRNYQNAVGTGWKAPVKQNGFRGDTPLGLHHARKVRVRALAGCNTVTSNVKGKRKRKIVHVFEKPHVAKSGKAFTFDIHVPNKCQLSVYSYVCMAFICSSKHVTDMPAINFNPFKPELKSHLLFAGIIRSSPFSPR
jgi:hypothetical protein